MRIAATFFAIFTVLFPDVARASSNVRTFWFYSTAASDRWCGVDDEKAAKAAAVNERFASGSSAMMRFGISGLESVIVMTQSDDAYVEDTYTFDKSLNVSALARRGHYLDQPYLSVTFVSDSAGRLVLSSSSARARREQDQVGHETYFVDWLRYEKFGQLPFAWLVNMRTMAIAKHCES